MNQSTERQKFMRARSELMSAIDILRTCNERDITNVKRALERADRATQLLHDIAGPGSSASQGSGQITLPRI